ncbi:tetratricopeptide repeat protein [Cocleimonas flava]|uniref:Ancillary SecYEG translocon subunit n=1 Tax=Cocleimonas flava TaxID=634765 RepID=A0A4R1EYU8_9GAMM|nr:MULTISPECIES: tetratricopeptide repeat protein [Cocleimonas]MEB8433458.1 tetratricopeptide repeat protein [Cocleimonas sp. KMM 6892]MEC4716269.1 tetratricopeptide repeat protein [Cocleimonas sp. KMM 6895]MEC4745838.1 tetratricopeptide repeat protein [Cocleimonas sp. KMM 6896]TCJ85099.1 putative negative regulator of RcsB-dependent stress response [Cocleimonas flava]
MADYDLKSDEEKAEELKAWWRSNGTSVIAGVALTVGGMFGWNYWKEHKVTQSEGASKLYAQLGQEGTDSAEILKKLNDEYSGTSYSYLAALESAKTSCEAGKTDDCIAQLKKAAESPQDSLANLAKLRLARALVSTGKLDEAKSILAEKMPASYQSLVSELNGDIHFAKKELKQAYEAYDKAILSAGDQNTQLLKMKRDDLGNQLKSGA